MLVDLGGRADLLDAAFVEDREAVAHRERLLLVVRDIDERHPPLALDPLQLDLHLLAQLQVERAERLVEQQHPRAVHERPRERHPLALAAGELNRLAVAGPGSRTSSRISRPARYARVGPALDAEPVAPRCRATFMWGKSA